MSKMCYSSNKFSKIAALGGAPLAFDFGDLRVSCVICQIVVFQTD